MSISRTIQEHHLKNEHVRRGWSGLYGPNWFMMWFAAEYPVIEASGAAPNFAKPEFPVLLHEYWHYLHNISTVSGFKSLLLRRDILPAFWVTLDREPDSLEFGECISPDAAEKSVLELAKTALEARDILDGQVEIECDHDVASMRVLRVYDVETHTLHRLGKPHEAESVALELEWRSYSGAEGVSNFEFGSVAVEESVVYCVETAFSEAAGHGTPYAPFTPYRVCEMVLQHYLPTLASYKEVVARLGSIALMTPYPGPAFVTFAKALADAVSNGELADSVIRRIREDVESKLWSEIRSGLSGDLASYCEVFQERGQYEKAAKYIADLIQRALHERMNDMYFDIDAMFPIVVPKRVGELVTGRYPGCNMIQMRRGDPDVFKRDGYFSTAGQFEQTPVTELLLCFLALDHFISAHTVGNRGFRLSKVASQDEVSTCPLYTCCDAEFRKSHPNVCKREPWASLRCGAGCAYAHSVAAAIGKFKATRVQT